MEFNFRGNYFNGEFKLPTTTGPDAVDEIIARECPADTQTILYHLPVDNRHIESIIESASSGYHFWRKLSLDERKNYLRKYQEQVLARKDEFASAIALETGKPLWEAAGETNAIIDKVTVTLDYGLPRIKDQVIEEIKPGFKGHLYYKPIGPTLIIGPFNFPCHLANTQIVNALLSGNSIIFKPSEKTAYSAQLLIECFHQAGFPKGVINLAQGGGDMASRILREKSIKSIFFTGSAEIGKNILTYTHTDLTKIVSLELGGKNSTIIHKDANLDHALPELIKSCFLTTGQRCTSTSLVIMHQDLIQDFIARFHELAKKIIIDHPIDFEKEPFMGPLVDQKGVDNYLNFMGMAKREGIIEIMRGKLLNRKRKGYFVSPSIHLCEEFDPRSHFLASEVFGPNCTFIPYQEIEQAIEIANTTDYGLAASIFTKDQKLFELCLRDLEAGLVNWNTSTCGASSRLPFGGVKNSGNFRPASIATIDSCVYQKAGLQGAADSVSELSSIKGLDL
ncbi:MAG: aldehyde dehydrogenase family protein [Halobacteriovoraceae bacterium]|jgi:succinylglutamic semialdehyde dehydrogenase|nr:aldehyde dehydrogenase family protein [Halobacteriovoraceae bacterium]